MRVATSLLDIIEAQRGHLFAWMPVFLGIGIAAYFAAPREPGLAIYAAVAGGAVLCAVAIWRGPARTAPIAVAVLMVCLGLMLAGLRAHAVGAPVLGWRYYGPIEGRIVMIDRSVSDRMRITLDQVVLENVAPSRTPAQVRISLHGDQGYITPAAGMRVILTGHLSPPNGPTEPGAFDFQRLAWFRELGAVGYTQSPVLRLSADAAHPVELAVVRLRLWLSSEVQARIPGEAGGFAAALTTGDRSGISEDTNEALRISSLYHIVSISGLHMGMLSGFVFGFVRLLVAVLPISSARFPGHKIAAVAALAASAFYLVLAGRDVATERSFIMVAVMLTAVLLDRRAISLRSVAISALIVMALRPEVLTEAGFQMSYAATIALVAAFSWMRDAKTMARVPRWLHGVVATVVSSAVAGLASGPIAAVHFNRVADYGFFANLIVVPVVGVFVMPGAVVAAVLAPIGLADLGLWFMGPGLKWTLWVAHWIAGLQGAQSFVPTPPPSVLAALTLGGLVAVLWQGWQGRLAGVAVVALGFVLWFGATRPAALIASDGALVGVMTDAGRALSKPSGSGYAAENWLLADGDARNQAQAHERAGFSGVQGALRFQIGDTRFAYVSGRGAADRVVPACENADIVIAHLQVEEAPPGGCQLLDHATLRDSGAIAVHLTQGEARLSSARDAAGTRLWNHAPTRNAHLRWRIGQ